MLRVLPHIGHSLLPKCADPVVNENYRRCGVLTPDQVHRELFELCDSNPLGEFLFDPKQFFLLVQFRSGWPGVVAR